MTQNYKKLLVTHTLVNMKVVNATGYLFVNNDY